MSTQFIKIFLIITVTIISVDTDLCAQGKPAERTGLLYVNKDTIKLNIAQNKNGYFAKKFKQLFIRRKAGKAFVQDREEEYVEYEDKLIRNVYIKVLDPFGPLLYDTTRIADSWIERMGNRFHKSTKDRYVKKLISFKRGDKVSAWELADNERLLRRQAVFNDASIEIVEVDENTVDILVLCEDVFSIAAEVSSDFRNKADLSVYHKNMFGIGHQLISDIEYDKRDSIKWNYGLTYSIKNINHSYIDFTIGARRDQEGDGFKIALEREFELASTKWAGLLSLRGIRNAKSLNLGEKIKSEKLFNYLYLDTWLGYSYNYFNNYKQVNNIMVAVAYKNTEVFDNPIDPKLFPYFMSRETNLISGTISERKYYKSNYIFDLGRTEDIIEGYLLNLTLGFEDNEQTNLFYSGFKASKSWFYKSKMEYLATSLGVGTFYNNSKIERGVVEAKFQSFSKLFKFNRSKIRFNADVSYIIGFNRYPEDFVYFDDYIRGFNSKKVTGKQKLSFKLTQNIFMPYIVNGCRCSFFTFADFGWIGSNNRMIFKTSDYYGFGVGMKFNNDNLIFKTFSIRLAYYPRVPSDVQQFSVIVRSDGKGDLIKLSPSRPEIIEYK